MVDPEIEGGFQPPFLFSVVSASLPVQGCFRAHL